MDIYKTREKYEEEARKVLRERFGEDDSEFGHYCNIIVHKDFRKSQYERYKKHLEAFHLLFNLDDERYRVLLWNSLTGTQKQEYYKADFSEEERDFLKRAQKVSAEKRALHKYELYGRTPNINAPIYTDRLILRAVNINEITLFPLHYRQDKSFILYCGLEPTYENVRKFIPYGELYFVLEDKSNNKVLGYVGLGYNWKTHTAMLEYYIFKQYRNSGYCKEAVAALCREGFSKKLIVSEETVLIGVYKGKKADIQIIRAKIASINEPSIKTVESCGFTHEATIHSSMYIAKVGAVDEKIYYMQKEKL